MSQLGAGAPALLCTTTAVKSLLLSLDSGYICEENRDGKFQELLSYKGISDSSSKCWCYVYSTCTCVHTCVGKAFTHVHIYCVLTESDRKSFIDSRLLDSPTIRHANCDILIQEELSM